MKNLRLYNTLSNSLENFVPINEDNILVYACGPTVYSSPHIGNARPIVVFDVLFRLLKKLYANVTYVRNITDVDDKINFRAREKKITIKELTDGVIEEFQKNLALIGVLPVTHEPRATFHIKEMLEIIQKLLDKGFAYKAQGHVLFRVRKILSYGMLSKRNLDDMVAGSRIEVAPYKEDPMDFVLWKPSEDGMPAWDSIFGSGRPGWHIECSAMSNKYLGERFDIHAGGQDLIFPHHENELAQNFGAFGSIMANYWIHNGMLLADGQKMSKSLGNIIALDDMLKQLDGEIIRYALLSSQYQKTLDWTDKLVFQARQSLDRLYGALRLCDDNLESNEENTDVLDALCGNLNTPLALKILHEISDKIYKSSSQKERSRLGSQLKNGAMVLGLLTKNSQKWFKQNSNISEEEIEQLILERNQAKAERNFKLADEIRDRLHRENVQIEDTKTGTVWRTV